jgi:hypothetical protein
MELFGGNYEDMKEVTTWLVISYAFLTFSLFVALLGVDSVLSKDTERAKVAMVAARWLVFGAFVCACLAISYQTAR